jgi:hypothetical protein
MDIKKGPLKGPEITRNSDACNKFKHDQNAGFTLQKCDNRAKL